MSDFYENNYSNSPEEKKEKKKSSFGVKLLKVVAIALVFGMVSGAAFRATYALTDKLLPGTNTTTKEQEKEETKKATTTSKSDSTTLSTTATGTFATVTDVSDIVEQVMPAIVAVTNVSIMEYRSFFGQTQQYESTSAGSGIIVAQDDEYIYVATNNHVVSGSESLTITFVDDAAVEATIVGTDAETDLAVVAVSLDDIEDATLKEIKVASLGSSEGLSVGESAIVIGNALGYGQSVTTGVISALDREVTTGDYNQSYTNLLIQTDAAVNPGNSGGALLNINGEVVGIVSAKYSDTDVEGMGYAIPISQAQTIIDELMTNGSATHEDTQEDLPEASVYIGINGMDVDSSMASRYNMPVGVYVASVVRGSGAADAGISKGDVVVKLDGKTISTMSEMKTFLQSKNVGDKVKVTVARVSSNYKEETVTVTLTGELN